MSNEKKKWTPIICVDFDGVLHSYTSGWKGAGNIPDPPVEGAMQWLASAVRNEKVQIAIYSSRSKDPAGIEAMKPWLGRNLYRYLIDEEEVSPGAAGGMSTGIVNRLSFPTQKPAAIMTIDDRAHCFMGKFRSVEWYLNFKPWNKRKLEPNIAEYSQQWSTEDEERADEALECLLDCLATDRDGFLTFEGSALEYMAEVLVEVRSKGALDALGEVVATRTSLRKNLPGDLLRETIDKVLSGPVCSSKCLDDESDREAVLIEVMQALEPHRQHKLKEDYDLSEVLKWVLRPSEWPLAASTAAWTNAERREVEDWARKEHQVCSMGGGRSSMPKALIDAIEERRKANEQASEDG